MDQQTCECGAIVKHPEDHDGQCCACFDVSCGMPVAQALREERAAARAEGVREGLRQAVDRELLRKTAREMLRQLCDAAGVRAAAWQGEKADSLIEHVVDRVLTEHTQPAPESAESEKAACDAAIDCGDNGCLFKQPGASGMRTNGGCSCFERAGYSRSTIKAVRQMLPEVLRLRRQVTATAQSEYQRGVREERERWQTVIENYLDCNEAEPFCAEVSKWIDEPPWVKSPRCIPEHLREAQDAAAQDVRGEGGVNVGDKTRGLHEKFVVLRRDGSSAPGRKHDGCDYFVLDLTHDPYAATALRAYADACREEYPLLAADLDAKVVSR